jgi:hypothetical protein
MKHIETLADIVREQRARDYAAGYAHPLPAAKDVDTILEERGRRYGLFKDHAMIAQTIKDMMKQEEGWARLAPDQKEALEMIAHKIARILNGDPDYADSWIDIAGYAKLVADRLEGTVR